MSSKIKIYGTDISLSEFNEPSIEKIEEISEYTFKVVNNLALPYKIFKDENGQWLIKYCNEIHIDGDIATCTKSTFDTIKNNKTELDKFKEWLNTNSPIETFYIKSNDCN